MSQGQKATGSQGTFKKGLLNLMHKPSQEWPLGGVRGSRYFPGLGMGSILSGENASSPQLPASAIQGEKGTSSPIHLTGERTWWVTFRTTHMPAGPFLYTESSGMSRCPELDPGGSKPVCVDPKRSPGLLALVTSSLCLFSVY